MERAKSIYKTGKSTNKKKITVSNKRGLNVDVYGFRFHAPAGVKAITHKGQAWARRSGRPKQILRP